MAALKLLMCSIALALLIYGFRADSEIDELRSRMSSLETNISDRIQYIKRKDENILILENALKEKSARVASIQSEIELHQKQAAADAEKAVEKAHKQDSELEKQVAKLKSNIETHTMKWGALEARGDEAEKKTKELNLKLETLQKIYDKQKLVIRSAERALQVAEEELMKAQLEAASKSKKLTKVHKAWLPPWLALRTCHFQEVAATHWNNLGKPALEVLFLKASQKSASVMEWAELHLLTTQTEVKKFSKCCIEHILNSAKPHFEKIQAILETHYKHAVYSYKILVKTTVSYHNQVQASIHENLEKHKLTKPLATRELSWFMASSILAFPIFFLFRLLSSIFSKKINSLQYVNRDRAPNSRKRKHKHGGI